MISAAETFFKTCGAQWEQLFFKNPGCRSENFSVVVNDPYFITYRAMVEQSETWK